MWCLRTKPDCGDGRSMGSELFTDMLESKTWLSAHDVSGKFAFGAGEGGIRDLGEIVEGGEVEVEE